MGSVISAVATYMLTFFAPAPIRAILAGGVLSSGAFGGVFNFLKDAVPEETQQKFKESAIEYAKEQAGSIGETIKGKVEAYTS